MKHWIQWLAVIGSIVGMLAFVSISWTHCWGKPYDLTFFSHIPWYGWTMLGGSFVLHFAVEWANRKEREIK